MNRSITLSLKKSKFTKRYYANSTDYNMEILLHQVSECMKLIVEAKDQHLAKFKIDNPHLTQKTHWSVINEFLNNENIPIIPPASFKGKPISDFQKLYFLITTLPHNFLWSKMQIPYKALNIKPMGDSVILI